MLKDEHVQAVNMAPCTRPVQLRRDAKGEMNEKEIDMADLVLC